MGEGKACKNQGGVSVQHLVLLTNWCN
jgi:hypothetical protein